MFDVPLIREPIKAQKMENTLSTLFKALGVFILTVIVVLGVTAVNQNGRKAAIDLSAKAILSDEDYEAFKDPQAANKKSMDAFNNSEAAQRSLQMQRQFETNRNWSMRRK